MSEPKLPPKTFGPPETDAEKKLAAKAVAKVYKECGGSPKSVAEMFGISRNSAKWWETNGYVGATVARKAHAAGDAGIGDVEDGEGFTLADLRPDIVKRIEKLEKEAVKAEAKAASEAEAA